jgi:hypothetical protein
MNIKDYNWVLLILAAISATLNFAGFAVVVEQTWWALSLAALTAVGVFVALYAFWKAAFSTVPQLEKPKHRIIGWSMVMGAIGLILSLSTYWNVVALTGDELERLSGGDVAVSAQVQLAEAGERANGYQSLLPQVKALGSQIRSLSQGEADNGTISGRAGKGSFTRLLDQIGGKVTATDKALADAGHAVQNQITAGQKCLPSQNSASVVSCVNRTIAALNQQKVAQQVKQSMEVLTAGVILPATLKTDQQKQIARGLIADIQKQANEIAKAASEIDLTPVGLASGSRPNVLQSVLLYWRSVIPAMATAIALDLLPLVLLVLVSIRRRDLLAQNKNTDPTTVEDLTRVSEAAKHLRGLFR